MENRYRICFLGYKKLNDIARKVIAKSPQLEADTLIVECTPDTLATQIQYALQFGCEGFIAGSSNAAEFRRISHESLTELPIQSIDYATAVKQALKIGKRPAIVTYRYFKTPDTTALSRLLDVSIIRIIYEDTYDLIEQMQNSDADVFIGASFVNETAASRDKKSVLVYPGEETVEYAFRRCYVVLDNLRKWKQERRIYGFILESSPRGIICTNEDGNIILYNPQAANITGISYKRIIGAHSAEVIPWAGFDQVLGGNAEQTSKMLNIDGHNINSTLYRIEDGGTTMGALMFLSPGDAEVKARESIPPVASAIGFDDLCCLSGCMQQVVQSAKRFGQTGEPCLIIGEPGTGKTTLAQCISNYCNPKVPTVSVNCALIPERQALQYFFGREDANGGVLSHGVLEGTGTLVLENLWKAPGTVLDCLTQAITERKFQRINGKGSIPLTAKILTVVPLEIWTHISEYISDTLYYCLTTFVLYVPPLRERVEDIPALFGSFVNRSFSSGIGLLSNAGKLQGILCEYSWPGNLYELSNAARRYALMLEDHHITSLRAQKNALIESIGAERLFEDIFRQFGDLDTVKNDPQQFIQLTKKLKAVLFYNNETIATKLGVSRTTLWRLLKTAEDMPEQ